MSDRVYLGSIGGALNHQLLRDIGVSHVLCVGPNMPPSCPELFDYKVLPLLDSPSADLLGHLGEALDFLFTALDIGAVLVHWSVDQAGEALGLALSAASPVDPVLYQRWFRT